MIREVEVLKEKTFVLVVSLGIFLGNIALAVGCPMFAYEPKKPDILKNEK